MNARQAQGAALEGLRGVAPLYLDNLHPPQGDAVDTFMLHSAGIATL